MDDWGSLLMGQISAEEADRLLAQSAEDLHAFLEARPQAVQHVLDILSKRLGGEINAETWQVLDTSLANYLGRDLAYLVTWVAQSDQGNRIQELEKHASSQVMAFLRTILGLYGLELENAFAVWNEIPDNWRTFYREVYYDQLSERHHLKLRIEKYNGEEAAIEGPPDSILTLTTYMILTLRLVGTPDAFSQDRIDLFLDEAHQLIQLLRPEEEAVVAGLTGEANEG